MKNKVATFEKVSEEQFIKDLGFNVEAKFVAEKVLKELKLPERATVGSAGYDFYSPVLVSIPPKETVLIPTGIRCKIDDGYVLQLFPRSGLGFKYGLQLRNTVGIIDSDYYNADNEGHIMAKLVNTGDETIVIEPGKAFMQGVFLPYFITYDDEVEAKRFGGIGSTDSAKLNV